MKSRLRTFLPSPIQTLLRSLLLLRRRVQTHTYLGWMRARLWDLPTHSEARIGKSRLRINDGPNCYMQYKDLFVHQIYRFHPRRSDPLIIDGGSNTGMSLAWFKEVWPAARILAFEPDPIVFAILKENIARNSWGSVTPLNRGVAGADGALHFQPDGAAGGRVVAEPTPQSIRVQVDRLSAHITEPVDFLKLNIEGQEGPVLIDLEETGKLAQIREIVLEYHGWAGGAQGLGSILDLLDRNGYRYLVHDFDEETGPGTKPPFAITSQSNWFCLVYACREDVLP